MASETDLINDSLGQIGAAKITAIDDGSINANHALVFYPSLRDGELRAHHWNFAMKRVELAQDAATPEFEFAFSYALPADSLKVVEYNGANLDTSNLSLFESLNVFTWKVEQRKILTNDGTVKIRYIQRVTNPDVWDALFYQAISSLLAAKLAAAITKDIKKALGLFELGTSLMSLAKSVDGQEGSVEPYRVDNLISGRR